MNSFHHHRHRVNINKDLTLIRRRRRGRRLVKIVYLFYFGISHLLRSIQCVCRYYKLSLLNMLRMRSVPNRNTKNWALWFTFYGQRRIWSLRFTLLFCRGRLRNVPIIITHVHSQTPRQNALRMSTNLSFRSITHFRLRIKIQCEQAKIPYREV